MEALESTNSHRDFILPGEVRAPLLQQQTNLMPPSFLTTQAKQLRRKATFIRQIDSSEDPPSSHDSIFEAEYLYNVNSEDSGCKPELFPILSLESPLHLPTSTSVTSNNEDAAVSPGITPILYGHGTPLTTIVEQKSTTTMRTGTTTISRTRSASDLSTSYVSGSYLLGHQDSFELSIKASRVTRRIRSFSADDLEYIQRSYHKACQLIESTTRRPLPVQPLPVHEIYAQPRTPIVPPLERPPTPAGMPSWTAAQIVPQEQHQVLRRIRRTPNRLQRFLGIQSNSVVGLGSRATTSTRRGLINGSLRAVSNNLPATRRGVPQFRPPRSGHGSVPLQLHPFMRNDSENAKGDTSNSPIPPQPQGPRPVTITNINTPIIVARRPRGKGKPNQRVRFNPLAGGYESQSMAPATRQSSSRRLNHCPHRHDRRKLNSGYQLAESNSSDFSYTLVPVTYIDPSLQYLNPGVQIEPSGRAPALQPLMDSTPIVNPELSSQKCWRCRVTRFFAAVDRVWEDSAIWCCWVCCGVEMDNDEPTHFRTGQYTSFSRPPRRRGNGEYLAHRQTMLDHVPGELL